jgi:predicted dehydrogenase
VAQRIIQAASMSDGSLAENDFIPDLVVIAVSTTQHASVVESLLNPPKILVLEKPGGSNSIACSRISLWAIENKVQVFVNYFRRYLSSSVKSRLHIKKLRTGKLLSAEINAYGTLLNIHSHFIDLGFFLTDQQIFCECTNKIVNQVGDCRVAFCNSCKVSFRLGGIGKLKQDICMSLEFENVAILVLKDGQRIEIVDKFKQVPKVFECKSLEYQNYQKVVYDKIAAMLRLGVIEECYLGLTQANKVHLFLESVGVNNETE